jgi:hypothetical protein
VSPALSSSVCRHNGFHVITFVLDGRSFLILKGIQKFCFFELIVLRPCSMVTNFFLHHLWFPWEIWPKGAKKCQISRFKPSYFYSNSYNYLAYLKGIHNFYFSSKCRLFFDFSLGSIPANFLYQLWYATIFLKYC